MIKELKRKTTLEKSTKSDEPMVCCDNCRKEIKPGDERILIEPFGFDADDEINFCCSKCEHSFFEKLGIADDPRIKLLTKD